MTENNQEGQHLRAGLLFINALSAIYTSVPWCSKPTSDPDSTILAAPGLPWPWALAPVLLGASLGHTAVTQSSHSLLPCLSPH